MSIYTFIFNFILPSRAYLKKDNMFREIRTKENSINQLDQFLIGYSCNVSPDVVTWNGLH
jgi:hypothetical protein